MFILYCILGELWVMPDTNKQWWW